MLYSFMHFKASWTHLASLGVMSSIDPPLLLQCQVSLKEMKQIGTGHGAASEEVRAHPALLEVVWRSGVRKDMNKEFPTGFEHTGQLCQEQLVVLHMLEQLNRDNPVKVVVLLKLVRHDVACDYLEILQTLRCGLSVNVRLLRS